MKENTLLWLPYPKSKSTKSRVKFYMELLRTVGAVATLLTCLVNLIMFKVNFSVLQYEYNQIQTEEVQ